MRKVDLLSGISKILDKFSVVSIHELGGVRLRCDECTAWSLEWPAHVDAPRLISFSIQAGIHWNQEHLGSEDPS